MTTLYLLVFEFLGTNELLLILVAALILFGPRKLPQLSRTLGKNLAEFKRASEDFKRTWEREVDLETSDKDIQYDQPRLAPENSIMNTGGAFADPGAEGNAIARGAEATTLQDSWPVDEAADADATAIVPPPSITPVDPGTVQTLPPSNDAPAPETPSKRDWL